MELSYLEFNLKIPFDLRQYRTVLDGVNMTAIRLICDFFRLSPSLYGHREVNKHFHHQKLIPGSSK